MTESTETEAAQLVNAPADTWSLPKPLRTPARTYWPAMMALGIVLFCLGVVTQYVFMLAGLGLMIWSIKHWVGELVGAGSAFN